MSEAELPLFVEENVSNDSIESNASNNLQSQYQSLLSYANSPFFAQPKSFFSQSPYYRPIRPQDIDICLLGQPLDHAGLSHPNHLMAQRLLLNVYEQDMVFLPNDAKGFNLKDFTGFYDPEFVAQGRYTRPALERFVFNWLSNEVHINGAWDLDAFLCYTGEILNEMANEESTLLRELTSAKDPENAAKFFLVQCAGDFLAEASAMGRNVLGNFGPHTSELFKIFIDEYGYGVHSKKHSTIFEEMMKQAGLSADIHYYWQFYTASSISLINYFHYVSANHGLFFRYIGALYYTEASLAFTTKGQSRAIKEVFKGTVSTQYFDEHSHIDTFHGKMALEKLIIPLVKQYGKQILPEILRGFEEFRMLQKEADTDFYAHLHWHDELEELKKQGTILKQNLKPDMFFVEKKGELSVTHTHPVDELFFVEEGEVELVTSPSKSVVLSQGEGVVIREGMIHGSIVLSPTCKYSVTALKVK